MNIASKLYRQETIKKYQKKIRYLGVDTKITIDNFLLSRTIISLGIFIPLLFVPKWGIPLAFVVTIIFYILYPYFMIDNGIILRKENLYNEAINFFLMLQLSLKSTHDLRVSLDLVSSKLNNSFAHDFKAALKRNKYNNNISFIFQDMVSRCPNQDVCTVLIDLGASKTYDETLTKGINYLSKRNNLKMKKDNIQIPIKLTVLALIFIAAFIIILIYMPKMI